MRVFLDVGAHIGETVEAVLDPKYRFDRIVCFEPVAICRAALRRFNDPRLEIMPFGLLHWTCERVIFGAGTPGASVFPDKDGVEPTPELCRFVRASEWLRESVGSDDVVFMKLNCEGSECDIIEDLLASDTLAMIAALMVDFDVRKIPSQRRREAEVREKLAKTGLQNYQYCEDVMIGSTHISRVQNWLHEVGADACSFRVKFRQAVYLLRAPANVRRAILAGQYGRISRRVAAAVSR